VIIRCDPVDGQQWTDGLQHYSDDGMYCVNNRGQDLVVFVGPLPQQDQTAEIERLRTELEQSQGVRRSLAAEIERLQAELRGYAAESHRQLRTLQQSHDSATATLRAEQRGAQQAYLAAIKTFLEASR
jgi:hypothetical protein